jgi:thymidylate kinase
MTFVTLEGIEGSGKSTQAKRLAHRLGPSTVLTQEPGGTELGRSIRRLLLDHDHSSMAAAAEVLLFFADRAQHVAEVIRPALEEGRSVVSDRYTDSSIAYQGYCRELDLFELDRLDPGSGEEAREQVAYRYREARGAAVDPLDARQRQGHTRGRRPRFGLCRDGTWNGAE